MSFNYHHVYSNIKNEIDSRNNEIESLEKTYKKMFRYGIEKETTARKWQIKKADEISVQLRKLRNEKSSFEKQMNDLVEHILEKNGVGVSIPPQITPPESP